MKTFLFAMAAAVLALSLSFSSAPVANAQGQVDINSIWLEHDVTDIATIYQNVFNGYYWESVPATIPTKGLRIHLDFGVVGLQGHQLYVCAYVLDSNYTPLQCSNPQYRTPSGQLCIQRTPTPAYEFTDYSDYTLFLPYGVIPGTGTQDLNIVVDINHASMGRLAQSQVASFTMYR